MFDQQTINDRAIEAVTRPGARFPATRQAMLKEVHRDLAEERIAKNPWLAVGCVIQPTQVAFREGDDYGGWVERDYLFVLERGMLLSDFLAFANEFSPATYCQHSYDCCGHYYGGGWYRCHTRKLDSKSGVYIITQRWTQNV